MDCKAFAPWGKVLLPLGAFWMSGCEAPPAVPADEAVVSQAAEPELLAIPSAASAELSQQPAKLAEQPTAAEPVSPENSTEAQAPAESAQSEQPAQSNGPALDMASLLPSSIPAPTVELSAEGAVAPDLVPELAVNPDTKAEPKRNSQASEHRPSLKQPLGLESAATSSAGNSGAHAEAPAEEFERTELPWARTRVQSAEMKAVVARAAEGLNRGFVLAERGALYSARSEFVGALRLIAQSLDAQQETSMYGKSLSAGLTALKETSDFIPRPSTIDQALDLKHVVAGHRTPVLKQNTAGLTPLVARQRYYSYAQEQLGLAAGQEAVGSMALYGLGKLAVAMSTADKADRSDCTAQGMVYYQAALLVDTKNARAANELGIILSQSGKLERARDAFHHALSISPNPITWQNMAIVQDRLGQLDLAADARKQAEAAGRTRPAASMYNVRWVDPETFARSSSATEAVAQPAPAKQPGPIGAPRAVAPAPTTKRMADWLPWSKPARR